jgi:hypothetical protein
MALDGASGASDNSPMTVEVSRLPFSLHLLIAEARRRARQRRLLIALVAVAVALAVGGAMFATRSAASLVAGPPAPGCHAHIGAGASYLASARTATAAAQRDEERLLCLVVLPQGAQRMTSEPALMARLGQRVFSFPKPFAPFARHRFWRVHSSVTALVDFEKAHPPGASRVLGCGTEAAADCGVGVWGGPNVPVNASLTFLLSPIRGRVGSRALRMTILGLPDGWTAFRVDAVNRPWTR